MPCRTDEPISYHSITSKDYQELQQKLNDATRAACTAMKAIKDSHDFGDVDREAIWDNVPKNDRVHAHAWYEKHEEEDRIRKERLIESAKAKLSQEEKEALGLK